MCFVALAGEHEAQRSQLDAHFLRTQAHLDLQAHGLLAKCGKGDMHLIVLAVI